MRIRPWLRLVGGGQTRLSSRYDCHLYAVRAPGGIVLFDAGSGLGEAAVLQNLTEEFDDLRRGVILLTHAHPDHVCGAASLSRQLGWPIIASELSSPVLTAGDEELSGLRLAREMGGYPADLTLPATPIAETYRDGESLDLLGLSVLPISVRGHARDSFVFRFDCAGTRVLLSADVLFYGGILGLINAAGSSLEGYREDLPKLAGLQFDALLPGHGLFTLADGPEHLEVALAQLRQGFVPRMIGQGDHIF